MRVLVFLLALVTSPLGAVVCEVACAGHALAGHHAAAAETVVEDHHHHGDVAPPTVAPSGGTEVPPDAMNRLALNSSELSSPDAACAPPTSQPATLRSAGTPRTGAVTPLLAVATAGTLDLVRQHTGGPPVWSSPPPPLLARIPLRI